MTRVPDRLTTTGARRNALIDIIQESGISEDKSVYVSLAAIHGFYLTGYRALADDLIGKFKWIARAISMYFDPVRVITAYEEREEEPGTELEKKHHNMFLALHPDLPNLVKFVSGSPEHIDCLAAVIDHHVCEAKNSDTSTLRHLISKIIPENTQRDVVSPPIASDAKGERGFNHQMTGALLCPLQQRTEYDQDPITFNNKVNAGEILITHSHYPSGFYPPRTIYNANDIEVDLFRGYAFIRALRAIFAGKQAILTGKRTASKASQAEMHGFTRVTPESVAYTGVHLVFALSNIENWSLAHLTSFNFHTFWHNIVRMFTDPEDEWSTETLDFLTKQLPPLRKKQMKKRRRGVQDEAEVEEEDDETTRSLQNRAAKRARAQNTSENNQVEQPEADDIPLRAAEHQQSMADDPQSEDEEPTYQPQRVRSRPHLRMFRSPSASPERGPPPSSSPARSSRHATPDPYYGLMGPPPVPRFRHSTTLDDLTNQLESSQSQNSQLGRLRRSPTLEPESGPSQPPQSSRRSTLRARTNTSSTAGTLRNGANAESQIEGGRGNASKSKGKGRAAK
ncbi:hypothetical protein CVT24_001580 [Panaeolus cyanescens]|uniref:Uncharacterized protein n=1 Tax=Panaeolus cyanescens TaxID=181874 RepID=A0A409WJ22_9AGAR|nr:hypothetical protein CVT24_001580 [Panaeolus cyanescens]